jgi:hypothetical protein
VARPAEVREVFLGEVTAELSHPQSRGSYEILRRLSRADQSLVDLMARALFALLEERNDIPAAGLEPLLDTISRGLENRRDAFVGCVIERFQASRDLQIGSLYLVAAFAVDPEAATKALLMCLEELPPSSQSMLGATGIAGPFCHGIRSIRFSVVATTV